MTRTFKGYRVEVLQLMGERALVRFENGEERIVPADRLTTEEPWRVKGEDDDE